MSNKLERFLDPYFYVSKRQLVSQLNFDVSIWRARVQDEESRQLCAVQRVRWNERWPAPRELCEMNKDTRHDETVFSFLSAHAGNTARDRLEQWLNTPYAELPSMERPDADPITATSTLHVFTRTEQDDFVNRDELACEVEPPHDPTPLAELEVFGTLKRREAYQRRQAAPMGSMASGELGVARGRTEADVERTSTGAPAGSSPLATQPPAGENGEAPNADDDDDGEDTRRTSRNRFYILAAAGASTFRGDAAPTWAGNELVLITLQELSDGQFIAKPSLGETHVLRVDDEFVISYSVSIAGHEHHGVHRAQGDAAPANRSFSSAAALASRSLIAKAGTIPPELQSEALEKQRRVTILRQLVATTGQIPRSSAGPSVDTAADVAPKFTLAPPNPAKQRLHYFGTVESSEGLEHTTAFLKLEFVLPIQGFEIDSDVNRKCGVAYRPELLSQAAVACRYKDGNNIYVTGHSFNMPFELHGIADDPTPVAPRLVVSAWSQEAESRQALLGYGVVTLAPQPGMHKKRVELWRPTLHGRETLRSYFVGGSVSLVDAEDAAIPYERRVSNLQALAEEVDMASETASIGVNSRAGLITTSGGAITVQWMCASQKRASAAGGAFARRYA